MIRFLFVPLALAAATPALAHDLREFCPDRPGLGTPACTLDPGHVMIETGLADWTLERNSEMRTDRVVAGDTLIRLGVADHAEAQLGWTPYGHIRTRNRTDGGIDHASHVGDVTLALRRNLMSPDGSGLSVAIMPYATLPVGRKPVGAGDWGAGLIVPMSFDLGHALSLGLTPEIDAAVDGDGQGRHLAYGSVIGLGADVTSTVSATIEASFIRDRESGDHATEALAGVSLGWQAKGNLQFDIGANAGLNHASADVEIYAGLARRF